MPPIELGPARPISAIDAGIVRAAAGGSAKAENARKTEAAMVQNDALDPGAAPVDAERVEVIRKAIANNSYPVVPTKVADAMNAAGILLRTPK
jgi:negative regulator of flagellin synthesis FlgM